VQGIGRSRGGPSTKVHLVVDALGLPLIFEITEGQRHDIQPAKGLLSKAASRCLLADKAYDSDDLRNALTAHGCSAVIPSKASRAQRLGCDKELYKARSRSSARSACSSRLVVSRPDTRKLYATTRPSLLWDARCSG
jgi:IS5 family transposase